MKKKGKIIIYVLTFILCFTSSALFRMRQLGSAPARLIEVEWNDSVGRIYKDLSYENDYNHCYDLYIPTGLDKAETQYVILYIHGGSFNSGSKEDGDVWCKFYASKGFITAAMDYTLQNHGVEAPISLMEREVENSVIAIKEELENQGYRIGGMAPCGVSAGGTLAMNLAYRGNSVIPIKFVFQLAAPTYFEPTDWDLLMRVDHLKTYEEFLRMMTGVPLSMDDYQNAINDISPSSLVNETSVPSLIGYGLKDHCVPLNQKYYLLDAFEKNGVTYDYFEFPKSNHGMYNDLDILQEFIDRSLVYCDLYFTD